MKNIKVNYIVMSLMMLMTNCLFSQTNFDTGFKKGFKEGYCYGKPYGCIAPTPPITPTPIIGESWDSYKDGYNRGFVVGKNKGRKNYSSDNSNSVGRYTSSKYKSNVSSSYYRSIDAEVERQGNIIYREALDYKAKMEYDLERVKDIELRRGIYTAKAYVDKVFVNGVRLGDAKNYLKKSKRLYFKAYRKYRKRLKKMKKNKNR